MRRTHVFEREPQTSDGSLSFRQKMHVFLATGMSATEIAELDDKDITFEFLVCKGVTSKSMNPVGVGPLILKERGASKASDLLLLGYDALHLADPIFCTECIRAYGAEEVKSAFLVHPIDALALTSPESMSLLGLNANSLLAACAGAPEQAASVLRILGKPQALVGVQVDTLLDTGLRAKSLSELGFTSAVILSIMNASPLEMAKLGF